MNINFEKIPVVIFDWIEKLSFEELSHSQKKEILIYFSEDEYNEMYQTSLSLRSAIKKEEIQGVEKKKEALLAHFDRYHAQKDQQVFLSKGVVAWQVAAILLMVLSGWLFYQVFDLKKDSTVKEVAATDTVYVNKEIRSEPEIIHDTVYRYKEIVKEKERDSYSAGEDIIPEEIQPEERLEALPLLELENLNITPRGNSMKDDSLLRKFGFVTM